MKARELVEMMAVIMDYLLHARYIGLYWAIEIIVVALVCFNKKDVVCYSEAYKSEMPLRDIPKEK